MRCSDRANLGEPHSSSTEDSSVVSTLLLYLRFKFSQEMMTEHLVATKLNFTLLMLNQITTKLIKDLALVLTVEPLLSYWSSQVSFNPFQTGKT